MAKKTKNVQNNKPKAQGLQEAKEQGSKAAKAQSAIAPAREAAKAPASKTAKSQTKKTATNLNDRGRYLWAMSYAPKEGESYHWLNFVPIAFAGAIIIMICRMYEYSRPMDQFYWAGGNTSLSEFFSWYKMLFLLITAGVIILMLLYRLTTQSLSIKRCFAYIPMLIYVVMVVVSYCASEYKEFALFGYNERFEGTLTLIAYMVLLFFTINTINNENDAKWIVYPVSIGSGLLGILGLTQGLNHDFFKTPLGQKLLMPNRYMEVNDTFLASDLGKALNDAGLLNQDYYSLHQLVDLADSIGLRALNFTFTDEIYQTVYNINYVSFYLTLIVPIVGMLFIYSFLKKDKLWKTIGLGILFTLLIYNLVGSESSGGWLGMFFVVLAGIIICNKRCLEWWKPLGILIVCAALMIGVTAERWLPEMTHTVSAATGAEVVENEDVTSHHINYFDTDGFDIVMDIDEGNVLRMTTFPDNAMAVVINDGDGNNVEAIYTGEENILAFNDERFGEIYFWPATDDYGAQGFTFRFGADSSRDWTFMITPSGVFYRTDFGAYIDLDPVPAVGFANNQSFGSGRGYILSRSIPMMKDTALIGHGADTYCLYFPHYDYVGKYNSGTFSKNINIIVDKPHCVYLDSWIGTGGISTIMLLIIYAVYVVQSALIYFRSRFDKDNFGAFAGAGIFFGITGFVISGLFEDSTVSVMPMFYVLLGTGIALNMFMKKKLEPREKKVKKEAVSEVAAEA